MKLRLIFGLALLSLVFGCSTDVELNAPYESTTVVFGILDAKESRQYVKINRTYLGDGNNAEYAQIRDSLEYDWSEFNSITMSEIVNGNVVHTHQLDSITIENKETDGVFYAPEQTVYYFDVDQADEDGNYLNPDAIYELNVDFANKEDVSAQTDIIDARDGNINQSPFGSMVQTIIGGEPVYNENVSLRWTTSSGARRYEYSLRFYYRENVWADASHTELVDSYLDSLTWKLGEFEVDNTSGGQLIEQSFNGLSFYNNVAARLEEDPLITREMNIQNEEGDYVSVSLLLSIANDELNTYISVNEPVTGIVQERPSYTNVSNGIGILASKSSASRGPIALSKFSREELATGTVTSQLNFCSKSDPQETFFCD